MPTSRYKEAQKASALAGEDRDCAVKAVSLVTGVPYKMALAALTEKGRKPKSGTKHWMTVSVIQDLGYEVIPRRDMLAKCRTPISFRKHAPPGTFLLRIAGHVMGAKDGQVDDWTNGRRHRLFFIGEVKPFNRAKAGVFWHAGYALGASGRNAWNLNEIERPGEKEWVAFINSYGWDLRRKNRTGFFLRALSVLQGFFGTHYCPEGLGHQERVDSYEKAKRNRSWWAGRALDQCYDFKGLEHERISRNCGKPDPEASKRAFREAQAVLRGYRYYTEAQEPLL